MNYYREHERRRAFSIWLRTGRMPKAPNADGIELKFNPWHDPENGRFTFAGTGRYYGRGSGGSNKNNKPGANRIAYVSDSALPKISNIDEAEVWRTSELSKH